MQWNVATSIAIIASLIATPTMAARAEGRLDQRIARMDARVIRNAEPAIPRKLLWIQHFSWSNLSERPLFRNYSG